jgi:FKBP-type peptidyl-prolyl cis-trans isomerase
MNKLKIIIYPFIAFLLIINTFAQQPQKAAETKGKTSTQVKLANSTDSSQYILGAYLGQYLNANGISITNKDLFIRGIDDVLSKKQLLVNADSIPVRMNEYLSRMVIERNRMLEKQLFENIKGQAGVGTLPNGVCYIIVKAGNGLRPVVTDSVAINIKGYLPEGKVFEDTYARKTPLRTVPANLITGMKEALQIMPAGSVWRVFIPASLAYADKGVAGVIPPWSAVVFDVELLEVIK